MSARGLLLTMTEPPAAMEEEFNAWYDTEHMQERLAVTGFRSARRWVADVAAGEGKYLATYELDSPDVLHSAEYLARFEGATPWTRRCLGKAVVFRRWACAQSQPGEADPHPLARALLMIAAESPVGPLSLPGALQARHFVASAGNPRYVALVELAWDGAPTLPTPQTGWFMRLYRAYAA
jgi:hypothetical protein